MKKFARASAIGLGMVVFLVGTEAALAAVEVLRPVGNVLALLLYPGTALVLATGNNRIHDFGFWGLALLVNWFLYTVIAFGWFGIAARRKKDTAFL